MLALDRTPPQPVAHHALTALQAGMLYHRLSGTDPHSDVQQVVLWCDAPLDLDRLRASWQAVNDRHEALRTAFRWDGDQPLAEVWDAPELPFAVDDRTGVPFGERPAAVEHVLAAERDGIELTRAPLSRVRVLRFGGGAHAIVWTNHHAILDGRARAIVLREIADRYAGRAPAPIRRSFFEHVARLAGRDARGDETFWRAYLRDLAAPTPLPASARAEMTAQPAADPARATRALDRETTAALTAFARAHGVTMTTLVQAAWALLLAHCANESEVVFGAVRACRPSEDEDAAEVVGPLINTLPLRVRVDPAAALGDWLRTVRVQWQALREVEHTDLAAIGAGAPYSGRAPLFATVVVVEHEPLALRARATGAAQTLGIREAAVRDRTTFPLTLAAAGTERLELRLEADPARYDRDDAARLLDMLTAALTAFPSARWVRDVSLTGADERRRVLGFNHTRPYPRDATLGELFGAVVARRPDAIAAQLGAATMTYAELARRAAGVALHLRSAGIGRGSFVGLHAERSFDMLAGLIGIVAAGAASVALDPQHPPARTAAILRDSGARCVLTPAEIAKIPAADPAAFVPDPRLHALDPALVMYTSGSTGVPKGAVLPHRAAVRTVCGADYVRFDATETFFGFVPLTFDVAVLEIWGPLLNGARLVLCPPGLPPLDVLAATIEAQGVTTLWLTTALFEHMVDGHLPRLRGVRQLIVGGDVMSPAHARRALAALPNVRLLNVYGPTEATVLITAQHLHSPPQAPIPIGAPIANARVYVLDAERRPVPAGVPGEIYTGGDGLALGYLNRPDLTTERFVDDPNGVEPDAKMYRSGDLGRWNADGSLNFLGRSDTQVKINGVRIELGEIEAALCEHPQLREAVAIAVPSSAGAKTLVAYAVPRGDRPTAAGVRAFLAARLPAPMVPAQVVFLDALPLTPTGKFDRKALPAVVPPERGAATPRRRPETAAQITVAAHMSDLIVRDDIDLDDDFFACGGDSLRAMRLVARLRTVFGVDLSIRDLLAAPTAGSLAAVIGGLVPGATRAPGPRVVAHRSTGSQAPFVFLHGDLAGGGYYCAELARRLGDDRPFYVIEPNGAENLAALPMSIQAAARENLAALERFALRGPLVLGGFCNGAAIAFEMARRLARAGIAIERVVMVDAFTSTGTASPARTARRCLRAGLRRLRHAHGGARARAERAGWEARHEHTLAHWRALVADYAPGTYAGAVTLLWTDEAAPHAGALTAAWRRLAPRAIADRVRGSHLTAITRHVVPTCEVLAAHVAGIVPEDWDERAIMLDRLQRLTAAAP